MRVLLAHNRYQIRGGEDTVVENEAAALQARGVDVDVLEVSNDDIHSLRSKTVAALQVVYSRPARALLAARIAEFRPDVVHIHNFFPRLTPSVYGAANEAGVPVVQTLHNYRLVCANGLLFRAGVTCKLCLNREFPWPAVQHGCYRKSRLGSVPVAAMISAHRSMRTFETRVDRFIALTSFARNLFIEHARIPPGRIVTKPNAAPDFGVGQGDGGYALFIGRLSPEKGIRVLLEAAASGNLGMPLRIAGDGPLETEVGAAHRAGAIEYLGPQERSGVVKLMGRARVLLIPSLWYEGLPMVVPEAFSTGLPIVASNLGSLSALVTPGENGFLVPAGNSAALAAAVTRFAVESSEEQRLRRGARATYDQLYRPDVNVDALLEIYCSARKGSGTVRESS